MIFVTVSGKGFERLIKKMDEIAKERRQEVLMQTGNTEYKPKHAKFFSFESPDKLEEHMKESDVIVTHGGTGSIMMSLNLNRPVVVVPRYKKYGECVDDHQLQITRELEKQKRVIAAYDIERLSEAIKKARRMKRPKRGTPKLIKFLDGYIRGLEPHLEKNEHRNH